MPQQARGATKTVLIHNPQGSRLARNPRRLASSSLTNSALAAFQMSLRLSRIEMAPSEHILVDWWATSTGAQVSIRRWTQSDGVRDLLPGGTSQAELVVGADFDVEHPPKKEFCGAPIHDFINELANKADGLFVAQTPLFREKAWWRRRDANRALASVHPAIPKENPRKPAANQHDTAPEDNHLFHTQWFVG